MSGPTPFRGIETVSLANDLVCDCRGPGGPGRKRGLPIRPAQSAQGRSGLHPDEVVFTYFCRDCKKVVLVTAGDLGLAASQDSAA